MRRYGPSYFWVSSGPGGRGADSFLALDAPDRQYPPARRLPMTIPTNPVSLTGAQRRALRGLGHGIKPVIQIGKMGITDGLVQATSEALAIHELIKLSVGGEAPVDRKTAPKMLATRTGSHVAQIIGRTALLYRRRHDGPVIKLPGTVEEGPRPGNGEGDEA